MCVKKVRKNKGMLKMLISGTVPVPYMGKLRELAGADHYI